MNNRNDNRGCRAVFTLWALIGAAGQIGCAGPDGENTSQVTAQLTSVPTGTQCVRITVTPTSGTALVQTFTLAAGASTASLSLGALPVGNDTVTGAAFAATCSAIGTTSPTYTADPIGVVVRAGVVTNIALTFRANNPGSVSVNFVPTVLSIAAGGYNSFALTSGAPIEWGVVASSAVPVPVPGPTTPATTAIAGGAYHACALHADGTVWCWGTNYYGGAGPGIPLGATSSTPTQVPLTGAFTLIAAGYYHTCAYRPGPANNLSLQAIFCWGYNGDGELGNGTTTSSATPVQVSGINFSIGVRSLSVGAFHSLATLGDGHYVGWGGNGAGQLGDGTNTNRLTAEYIATDATQVAIFAGYDNTCSLHADGSVWCWGLNSSGGLGDGTRTERLTPTQVIGLPLPAKQVISGIGHTCALLTNGQVDCWGTNAEGELGDLTGVDRLTPAPVNLGVEVVQGLAGGFNHTCAFTNSLNIWCWGYNPYGQIGDGTINDAFGPTKVLLQ